MMFLMLIMKYCAKVLCGCGKNVEKKVIEIVIEIYNVI